MQNKMMLFDTHIDPLHVDVHVHTGKVVVVKLSAVWLLWLLFVVGCWQDGLLLLLEREVLPTLFVRLLLLLGIAGALVAVVAAAAPVPDDPVSCLCLCCMLMLLTMMWPGGELLTALG